MYSQSSVNFQVYYFNPIHVCQISQKRVMSAPVVSLVMLAMWSVTFFNITDQCEQ